MFVKCTVQGHTLSQAKLRSAYQDMSAPSDGGEKDVSSPLGSINENSSEYKALERKTLYKLDSVLVTTMAILYLLAFLDRSNIGNARVAGLQADLGMSDHEYQTGEFPSL